MTDRLVEVQIEITHGEAQVKYEIAEGKLIVDRFLRSMPYPANYGSVVGTIGGDGDPIDVFLITPAPLQPGCFIKVRAIGGIMSHDEGGEDLKVIALPAKDMTSMYNNIKELSDLAKTPWGQVFLENLEHFLKHYKDLETDRSVVSVGPWYSKEDVLKLIDKARIAYMSC
jgi:inorganic pyrophosphatase